MSTEADALFTVLAALIGVIVAVVAHLYIEEKDRQIRALLDERERCRERAEGVDSGPLRG